MGDITDPNEQHSPSAGDDALATGNGNGAAGAENRGVKRARVSTAAGDDDDDDDDKPGRERRKIDIKFIQDKSRRHITFSKRKAGIMKKVRSLLTWSAVVLVAVPACYLGLQVGCACVNCVLPGLRTFGTHRHPSPSPRRLRDWPSLHFHNAKVAASCHQTGRQEPYPGKQHQYSLCTLLTSAGLLECTRTHPG